MNGGAKSSMAQAATDLRYLARENERLEKQAAQFDKLGQVREILEALINKGHITQPGDVLSKLAELLDKDANDLAVLTKAAQLEQPAFLEMARALDVHDDESAANATDRFQTAILR